MIRKGKVFWVGRDTARHGGNYFVANAKPNNKAGRWTPTDLWDEVFKAVRFERLFGICLEPGEGPIKVTIQRVGG
jgi:hypothetical protein